MSQKNSACCCTFCGAKMEADDLYCMECGEKRCVSDLNENEERKQDNTQCDSIQEKSVKQEAVPQKQTEPRKVSTSTILLITALVLMTLIAVSLAENYRSLFDDLRYAQNRISSLQFEINDMENKVSFYEQHVVFVSDDGTEVYHKYGCSQFDSSYFWAYNTKAAESKGYEPCGNCCD